MINPTKRRYNQWVANETLEDFALRYTATRARKWSDARVANTALGIVSFLALEAIGGAITLQYGFTNSLWAIGVVSLLIFLFGLPICYHAARSGLDIDLLTRGAGFGYIAPPSLRSSTPPSPLSFLPWKRRSCRWPCNCCWGFPWPGVM